MMKNFVLLAIAGVFSAASAVELPVDNSLMYNKKAAGFVEVKFNRSTRLESLRTLKPARNFIKRISAAYFTCGQWNVHSLPKKSDGTDHVPAGFNKLEKFDFKNPATAVTIRNEHFLIERKCSLLPDSAIFKYEGTWESLQDNYIESFFISFSPEKEFTKVYLLRGNEKIGTTRRDRHNPVQGDVMICTDESGRNGFAVIVDHSLYADKNMGAFFRWNSVHLPGFCNRNLKKGDKIPLTVYFALFNDSDPVTAANEARKKIFGEDISKSVRRPDPRPQVTTGKRLAANAGTVFWRMAPELLPAESPLPSAECGKWQISGAGNEFIAEELVVTPAKKLKNFKIKLNDFVSADGKKLSADKFAVESIVSIPRNAPLNSCSVSGEYADRLLRTIPAELEANKHNGFLISGKIPAKTPAGIYQGSVEISADGMAQTLPLAIRVYGFTLPEQAAYYGDFLISGPYADKFSKDKAAAGEFCKKDVAFLRIHPALSCGVFYDKNGKLTSNAAWNIKQEFKKYNGTQRFRVHGSFRCTKFRNLKDMSPELDAAMSMFADAVQRAFEPAGLIDKVLWQIGDECHIADKLKSQIHYSRISKKAAPKLRTFATINGFNPRIKELVEVSDIIAPHMDIFFKCIKDKMDISNKEIWIYDNDFMTGGIRLSKVRGVAWKSFDGGISGYHQWSVNAWVKDWRPGDDYSGCIYYPPEDGIDALPQRSMRMVNFALTVGDYDYLVILKNLIKKAGDTGTAAAAQKELDRIVKTVSPAWHEQTSEYGTIENAKAQIAGMIESMLKADKK
ncbi:MAG: DUF4091 domain-containing protein [Lentisphaerae bacterium]|nr:DUF4091 domain-containing protein [Lentisphaerota bacterium]